VIYASAIWSSSRRSHVMSVRCSDLTSSWILAVMYTDSLLKLVWCGTIIALIFPHLPAVSHSAAVSIAVCSNDGVLNQSCFYICWYIMHRTCEQAWINWPGLVLLRNLNFTPGLARPLIAWPVWLVWLHRFIGPAYELLVLCTHLLCTALEISVE